MNEYLSSFKVAQYVVREEEMGVSMRWMSASIFCWMMEDHLSRLRSDAFKGKQTRTSAQTGWDLEHRDLNLLLLCGRRKRRLNGRSLSRRSQWILITGRSCCVTIMNSNRKIWPGIWARANVFASKLTTMMAHRRIEVQIHRNLREKWV